MHKSMRSVVFLIFITSGLLLIAQPDRALAQTQSKLFTGKKKTTDAEKVQLPEKLDSDQVDDFIAPLSDEQVRRLLIEELKEKAALEAAARETQAENDYSGLAGFVDQMRGLVNFTRARINLLMSGATDADDEISRVFTHLGESEGQLHPVRSMASAIALFAGSLLVYWLFRRYTTSARRRLEAAPPGNWWNKLAHLALRSFLDLASICVFALATLALFFIFLDHEGPERLVVATYLAAFLIVLAVNMVSQFLLSPYAPTLRYLPLNDDNSRYIHKWVRAIAAVVSFGLLTCGLMKVERISEATHIVMVATVALAAALMLVVMILQKRVAVAEALRSDLPESTVRARVANIWHLLAIFLVCLLWVVGSLRLIIVGFSFDLPVLKTILMVPLFFILDWILQSLLKAAFGIVRKPVDLQTANPSAATESDNSRVGEGQEAHGRGLDVNRMHQVLRTILRVLLAALVFYWILDFWGIDLQIVRRVASSGFDVLLVMLLGFVAWELIKAPIERKVREEMHAEDEEADEGGKGGTRLGTLLVLLRKFILAVLVVMVSLIVLSALGVNIGPLIAGAGIVGIAVGFGAQTLVRDILSGVFFLIDDAFRVGDYIEAGGVRGTVEHISLRSLRLRHHRGMLQTIPFGDMKSVTNYSRDYIVMKLEFRVRYDTNVEKIRKIIKKINKKIQKDEEMGPSLLDKIKSQGVREMDDSAMIMRVKFKAVPGEQFALRREVYRQLQEAFRENGIEFAHRNVTVYFPPEPAKESSEPQSGSEAAESKTLDEKKKEAAAAAAIRTIEEEEVPEAKPDEP